MIRPAVEWLHDELRSDGQDEYLVTLVCNESSHPAGVVVDAFTLGKDDDDWSLVERDLLAFLADLGWSDQLKGVQNTSRSLKGDRFVPTDEPWPTTGGITRQVYKFRCPKCRMPVSAPADRLHPILDKLAQANIQSITLVALAARLRNTSARNSR